VSATQVGEVLLEVPVLVAVEDGLARDAVGDGEVAFGRVQGRVVHEAVGEVSRLRVRLGSRALRERVRWRLRGFRRERERRSRRGGRGRLRRGLGGGVGLRVRGVGAVVVVLCGVDVWREWAVALERVERREVRGEVGSRVVAEGVVVRVLVGYVWRLCHAPCVPLELGRREGGCGERGTTRG